MPLHAQWYSFDLDEINTDNFKQEALPLIKSISLSSVSHLFSQTNLNNRLNLGIAYSYGVNISGENSSDLFGGYPNFAGSVLITDNLQLKGNLSILYSAGDLINSFAYGIGLKLTNKEANNWKASVLLSNLHGPEDTSIKAADVNIAYDFIIRNVSLFTGFGINSFKSKILIEDELISEKIDGNANHVLLGAFLVSGNFSFVPILQLSSDVVVLSIELSRAFR
jgi:hypothetical protein